MNKKTELQKKNAKRPSTELHSLEDVAMRQVVNQMKIKMEQERLMLAIMPGSVPTETAFNNGAERMESLLGYVTLGISAFRMVKRTISFFRGK